MNAIKKEDASMTSQEMLDRSSSWTLACDNALLNRLKKFSEDLTRNSQDILRECDTLSRDVTQLDFRLINVSNEFLMLSNTQFVENRVEEFKEFSSPVSSANTTAIGKTKAEQEAALVSKMKQAIQLGLTACNERRQPSETSINRFKTIQPYLIGSPKFFSSRYCGLVDESVRHSRTYQESLGLDSVSIDQMSDTYATPTQAKHEVKFTMPPTAVFPVKVPDLDKPSLPNDNHVIVNEGRKSFGFPDVPPSPSFSNRSSERGTGSGSSISRGNMLPRSVTDELNKIYGSIAPPPTGDDDSDDDFRPNAGVGRIFEDDDDDIFEEKDFFPSSRKNDFFGKSNPTPLPTPVFSVPPPVNPVPHSKPSCVQTLVGQEPKSNDIPNKSSVTGNTSKKDVLIRGTPPEADGSFRPKLPPGAVSLFGNLPPPVFNSGTRQEAQTANTDVPASKSKPDTQISSNSTAEVASVFVRAATASTISRDITTTSSHVHEDVNQKYVTSQPSRNVAAPGRTKIISQGSLSGPGNIQSKAKTISAPTVPVNSLFADESSDEDIFLSSKKQKTVNAIQIQPPKVISNINVPITSTLNKNTVSDKVPTISSKPVKKPTPIKKSIFDDSESEDDLFSSRPSTSRSESKKIVDNGSIFKPKPEPKKLSVPVKVKKTSLFSDDSDSDTDLFGNKRTVQQPQIKTATYVVAPAKMEDTKVDTVWDDDDDDLFKDTTQKQKAHEASPLKSNLYNNNNEAKDDITKDHQVIKSNSNVSITTTKPTVERETEEKPTSVKKSIFDDSESDDDFFSSKSSSNVVASKSNSASSLDFKPAVPPVTSSASKGKSTSLFDDDSDSDSDLFGAKSKKKSAEKSVNSSKDTTENDMSSNEVSKVDEVDGALPQSKLNKKELFIFPSEDKDKDEDEPKPTKVTGNKISEKIKAMQNANTNKSKSENTDNCDVSKKKHIKAKVSVKSLALNLNINPLALMVGAKPPKSGVSTPSTPDREFSDQSPVNEISYTLTLPGKSNGKDVAKKNDEEAYQEKDDSVLSEENKESNEEQRDTSSHGIDELVGILKARVRIQRKRRPPTRNFLKSLAVHKQDEDNEEDKDKSQENQLNKEDSQEEASISDSKQGEENDVDKDMEESD